MNNREPWLCFFDIDGTLLFSGGISPQNTAALARLRADGHKLIINTGRSRAMMLHALPSTLKVDGRICGSAYVEYAGRVLQNLILDDETVRAVCRYAAARGERLCLEGVDRLYTLGEVKLPEAVNMTRDLERYLAAPSKLKVTKITFFDPLPKDFEARFPALRRIEFATYAEGIRHDCTKATGMALLCEQLGIPRARTIAFGDSENDIEMLDYAAQSVIMHHAPACLDAYATLRTDGDADGVAEGICKLFYGEGS